MVGRHAGRDLNRYFDGSWDAFEQAIQSGFDFHRVNNWGGFINTNLFIVHYKSDFTVTRTEIR